MTADDRAQVDKAIDHLKAARDGAPLGVWAHHAAVSFDLVLSVLEEGRVAADELPSGDEPGHGQVVVMLAEKILEVK